MPATFWPATAVRYSTALAGRKNDVVAPLATAVGFAPISTKQSTVATRRTDCVSAGITAVCADELVSDSGAIVPTATRVTSVRAWFCALVSYMLGSPRCRAPLQRPAGLHQSAIGEAPLYLAPHRSYDTRPIAFAIEATSTRMQSKPPATSRSDALTSMM